MKRRVAWWTYLTVLAIVVGPSGVTQLEAQSAISADGVVESRSGGFQFPDGTVQITASCATVALVEDSGQTTCWDINGNPISCAGTGMDGELRAGVAWPTPRFTDNGDGTATDNLTGLTWLQDAGCLGNQDWSEAFTEVAALNAGSRTCADYTGTFPDWRLPNIRELLSLVDYGAVNPAMPSDNFFVNLSYDNYWTSTTSVYDVGFAHVVHLGHGLADHGWKPFDATVLPVRGGQ
jgi:hypothetical protein